MLIVEDNCDVADVFKNYLELFDVEVAIESNYQAVLTRAQGGSFDAYIVDIAIHNPGSFALAQQLREMEFSRNSKILATTSCTEAHLEAALQAGFDALFIKPN